MAKNIIREPAQMGRSINFGRTPGVFCISNSYPEEGAAMAVYMSQFSYTTEAWRAMVKNPQDRGAVLKEQVEKIGGKFICLYYTYGDYDGVAIYEFPDTVTSVAAVISILLAGHLKEVKTTVLVPSEEAMKAMKKAKGIAYPAPK